LTKVNLP